MVVMIATVIDTREAKDSETREEALQHQPNVFSVYPTQILLLISFPQLAMTPTSPFPKAL
jgi:hypothetical protein